MDGGGSHFLRRDIHGCGVMSEITRSDNGFEMFVSQRLSAMCSILNTYGKSFGTPMLQGWMIAILASQVSAQEFSQATEHFMTTAKDLPTPSECVSWIKERRSWSEAEDRMRSMTEQAREEERLRAAILDEKYKDWSVEQLRGHVLKLLDAIDGRVK